MKAARRDGGFEAWAGRTVAFVAIGIVAAYGAAMLWLVLRGARALFAFTWARAGRYGIPGELRMRLLLSFAIALGVAWVGSTLLVRIYQRHERWLRLGAVVVAAGASLLLIDRLPPFLVALPSELRAGGGIGPQLFNTVYLAILCTAVTVPIGVAAGVYIARFARSRIFVGVLRGTLDTLASLPSLVYGLFGFFVFVVALGTGYSLLAGAFVLALVNLPLVVSVTEQSLRDVPRELEDAALALGASPMQTIWRVTLPAARRGILGAVVLAVGRVFAESAPLILTAGTAVSRATAYSLDPLRGGETLAVHLWYVNSAALSPDRADVSAGTAAVLVVLVALFDLLAARLTAPRRRRTR